MEKDFVMPKNEEEMEKEDRKFYFLVFILIITLIILLSTISFNILNKYVIGTDDNTIDVGSVLFSFNEGNNHVRLVNTMPVSDEVGKKMSSVNEYFDFDVSIGFEQAKKTKKITYEISLVPDLDNDVSSDMIRVYLEENNQAIPVDGKDVNSFSSLSDSSIRSNSKLLLKKTVTSATINSYRFRMWLSDKYKVDSIQRTFKCYVAVDAY